MRDNRFGNAYWNKAVENLVASMAKGCDKKLITYWFDFENAAGGMPDLSI